MIAVAFNHARLVGPIDWLGSFHPHWHTPILWWSGWKSLVGNKRRVAALLDLTLTARSFDFSIPCCFGCWPVESTKDGCLSIPSLLLLTLTWIIERHEEKNLTDHDDDQTKLLIPWQGRKVSSLLLPSTSTRRTHFFPPFVSIWNIFVVVDVVSCSPTTGGKSSSLSRSVADGIDANGYRSLPLHDYFPDGFNGLVETPHVVAKTFWQVTLRNG